MDRAALNDRLARLAFRYLTAPDGEQANRVLADLYALIEDQPGDYYVVFERLCDSIAEHQATYVTPLSLEEVVAWLNE